MKQSKCYAKKLCRLIDKCKRRPLFTQALGHESRLRPLITKVGLVIFACAVSSCATPSKSTSSSSTQHDGQWHGKVLLKNKKTQKSNTLVLDAYARDPQQMRLEVTTQIGLYLASIVLEQNHMTYLLAQQRRFVQTDATAASLSRFASIPLDPHVLLDLLFDRTPIAQGWVCEGTPQPKRCTSEHEKMAIVWDERDESHRLIHFDSPSAEGQLSLKEVTTKVELKDDMFRLKAPDGYKIETHAL